MQQHYDQREPLRQGQPDYRTEYVPLVENLQNDYHQGHSQAGPGAPQPQYWQNPQQQYYAPLPPFGIAYQISGPGTDSKLVAAFSYLGLWLSGFLLILFVRNNRFIRFHAMQSLLFYGGVNIMYIVLITIIVHHVPFLFGFAIFAFVMINIVAFIAWFVGLVGALSGKYVKLPLVGDFAERFANGGATVK